MTDRDLFYCTDFACDGHARSNEKCADLGGDDLDGLIVSYCDRALGVTHTAADHDACERRRIEALRAKPAPTYTVSGNAAYIQRLDSDGNPTGEPFALGGSLTNVEFALPDDADVVDFNLANRTMTLDLTLNEVSPELLALLTGVGTPAEPEFEVWYRKQPWYKRLYWWAQAQWRRLPGVTR
jgi:hypothetical protein